MFALTKFLLGLSLACFSQTFNIAVVEFAPVDDEALPPKERLTKNTDGYIKIIERLSASKVELIVFPQAAQYYGRRLRDKPQYASKLIERGFNPCSVNKDPTEYLARISCACRKAKVYVSFSVLEYSESMNKFYSTMLAFDNTGSIAAINRNDDEIGSPDLKQVPGVAFEIPMLNEFLIYAEKKYTISLVQTTALYGFRYSYEKMFNANKSSSTLYLIPSNWVSELPFLTAPQMYQMWADEYRIPIFYAGCHVANDGFGGTGILVNNISASIYTPQSEIIFTLNLKSGAELLGEINTNLTKEVDVLAAELDTFHFRTDGAIRDFVSVKMDLKEASAQKRICFNKDFCCNIGYKIAVDKTKTKQSYVYHLVAFSGPKYYHDVFKPGGVQMCGIVACLSHGVNSCGHRFPKYGEVSWPVTFEEITVSANFGSPYKQGIYYNMQFPNSLLSSMRPIPSAETNWSQEIIHNVDNDIYQTRVFKLLKPQNRLFTFGIFARDFFISKSVENGVVLSMLFVLNLCCFFI